MRRAIAHRVGVRALPRALHGAKRDADLRFARWRSQFLDRLAQAIAAEKIHRAIGAGRIALQHFFDQADGLEVVAPVERRTQVQAGQRIGNGHLRRRLPLMFAADGVFRGQVVRAQVLFDGDLQRRQVQTVFAHSLQDPHDERRVGRRGKR